MILKPLGTCLETRGWLSIHHANCIRLNCSMLAAGEVSWYPTETPTLSLQVTAQQSSSTSLHKEIFLRFIYYVCIVFCWHVCL